MLSCQLLFLTPDFLISNIIALRSSGAFSLWSDFRAPTGTSSMSQPNLENIYHYKQLLLPRGFLLILRVVNCVCLSVPALINWLKLKVLKIEWVGGSSGCVLELRFGSCCRIWAPPTLCFGSGASVLGSFWKYSLLCLISKYLIKPAQCLVVPKCHLQLSWGLKSVLWCCVQLIHISYCGKILKNPPLLMRGEKHWTN